MARSFLDAFSPLTRALWPSIYSGVAGGLSARTLGSVIRRAGGSISNEALFSLARKAREIVTYGQSLRFTRPGSIPDPFRLPTAATRTLREYAFTVEVRGTLLETGAGTKQHITISTNELMSRRELEELAAEIASSRTARYGVDVEESVLVSGVKAGTLGTL